MTKLTIATTALLAILAPECAATLQTPQESGQAKRVSTSPEPLVFVQSVESSGDTLEAIKTLQKRGIRLTTKEDRADYIVQLTREPHKKSYRKDTKVVLIDREGTVVYANSTRSVGGAMGDVADYLEKRQQ